MASSLLHPSFQFEILFVIETDGILSSFRLISRKHFPLLSLYCSNMVDLGNNGTSHQFIVKQVLCKAVSITCMTACRLHTRRRADYTDDRVTITILVLTLA